MNEANNISTSKAPKPVGAYPHARRVGPFLFLSGMGPRKPNTKSIPGVTLNSNGSIESYDFKLQCESVFENLRTIIHASNASMDDIVDIQVFLTNMKDDFSIFNEYYSTFFNQDKGPTRTTIEVKSLPTPIAVELKVIAYLGQL